MNRYVVAQAQLGEDNNIWIKQDDHWDELNNTCKKYNLILMNIGFMPVIGGTVKFMALFEIKQKRGAKNVSG